MAFAGLAAIFDAAVRRTSPTALLDFIPQVSPKYQAPHHLRVYVDVLTRALKFGGVRAVVSTPPRHGKSETTFHLIVMAALQKPGIRIAYVTYAAEFSARQSKKCDLIAQRAGAKFTEQRLDFWRFDNGSTVIWTSIGGPLTGEGVNLLIVDDPVKDRAQADSATYRENAVDWFNDVAYTRLEPGDPAAGIPDASAIVIQTRWHPDDLAGHLIAMGWPRINLPAINAEGKALWPERWPLEKLADPQKTLGEYGWSSLYQGEPRHRGGSVFKDPTYALSVPQFGFRASIGADFAYSRKTYADYSVAVVMLEVNGLYYITDVCRKQVEAPVFGGESLKPLQAKHGCQITAYIGGTERGIIDFMKTSQGLRINAIPATADKFSRAQSFAAAWNAGRVILPTNAPWRDDFVSEVCSFTGVSDKHDDQVDAAVAAFDFFAKPKHERCEW